MTSSDRSEAASRGAEVVATIQIAAATITTSGETNSRARPPTGDEMAETRDQRIEKRRQIARAMPRVLGRRVGRLVRRAERRVGRNGQSRRLLGRLCRLRGHRGLASAGSPADAGA